jgi:zinc/manganese transport system substrate-binding protein
MVFNSDVRTPVMMLAVSLVVLASVAACSSGVTASSGVIDIVAGENFWGNIAAQIGGSHVKVSSIISDPNADPHEYETDTHNAAEIAHAGLVIQNGVGYDDFLTKLLSVSAPKGRQVLHVDQVMSVSGENPNPHLWYDTAKLPLVADAIARSLATLDPGDTPTFDANARAFVASLKPITGVIATIKSRYGGDAIAYTERVPGYLVDAAGLTLGVPASFAQAVEDGNDPSVGDTAAFDSALQDHKVAVLLYNSQVTDPTTQKIESLAIKDGVPIVGVSETLPASDKNFQNWQLRQAQELLTALGG